VRPQLSRRIFNPAIEKAQIVPRVDRVRCVAWLGQCGFARHRTLKVVNPLEMADLSSEYQRYGANVRFDNSYPAEHGWKSPDGELACGTLGSPYMVRCSANGAIYDSVKTWLTMFLGPLKPRNNGKLSGTLSAFNQTGLEDAHFQQSFIFRTHVRQRDVQFARIGVHTFCARFPRLVQ
jgi:hypothetical protein